MSRKVVIGVTAHATKQMPCRTCGEPMTVGIRTRNSPRHLDCGVLESAACMRQIHDRSGPYYEKWRLGMLLAAERLARGTPAVSVKPPGSDESCEPESGVST